MNDLTNQLTSQYVPRMALVVYTCDRGYDSYYIESRPIIDGNMGAGAPLSEKTYNAIIEGLGDKQKKKKENALSIGGAVPEGLIYFNYEPNHLKLIWHRPAELRGMNFSEGLHIPDGPAMVPPMLYVADNGTLKVFALKDNKRPSEKTKLYIPPFHNCSSSGSVCLGSAKAKFPEKLEFTKLIEYYEKLFWGSNFTHNGAAEAAGNLNLIWKSQIANPSQKFNLKLLKPSGIKFQSLFS